MTDGDDSKASGIVTCSPCLQLLKKFEPIVWPGAQDVYTVRLHNRPKSKRTHYLDLRKRDEDRTVCGTELPVSGITFTVAQVDNKATCILCLSSPKVPSTLREQRAIDLVKNRGKYHRMYPTDFPISD